MISLTPKNWTEFQHYKDRSPAWIKLHRSLLDDYEFACLPVASRALAPCLWLLASEHEGGKIECSIEKLAFRVRMNVADLSEALQPLIDSGFFISASGPLATCKRDAIPEDITKTQVSEQKKKEDIRAVGKPTRPIDVDFEEFWETYPKRDGANPKAPALKRFKAAVRGGVDPAAIISAAARYRAEQQASGKIGTSYVAQAMTWLNQSRWVDYPATAPPAGPSAPVWMKPPQGWKPSIVEGSHGAVSETSVRPDTAGQVAGANLAPKLQLSG